MALETVAYRKGICFKVIIGLQNENRFFGFKYANTVEEKLEQEVRLLQLDVRHRYTLVISGRLTAKDCDLPKTPPNTKWSHKKYAD